MLLHASQIYLKMTIVNKKRNIKRQHCVSYLISTPFFFLLSTQSLFSEAKSVILIFFSETYFFFFYSSVKQKFFSARCFLSLQPIYTAHRKAHFLLTIFFFFVLFVSCGVGDFRHGCAGAGDEVYRSLDPGQTDFPSAAKHQPTLRQEQPPHQHFPLRPQRPKGTDVRGVIYFPYSHLFTSNQANHKSFAFISFFFFLIVSINCHHQPLSNFHRKVQKKSM